MFLDIDSFEFQLFLPLNTRYRVTMENMVSFLKEVFCSELVVQVIGFRGNLIPIKMPIKTRTTSINMIIHSIELLVKVLEVLIKLRLLKNYIDSN